jgi:hypothetical protein
MFCFCFSLILLFEKTKWLLYGCTSIGLINKINEGFYKAQYLAEAGSKRWGIHPNV